jgi:hypothetical protein
MKFSIGDQILLKRTGEEGRVVAFLSKTMMEVEVDGVRFPVYNEEVDHPYLKWFTEKKKSRPKADIEIPSEKPASRAQRLARGIYLSFLPQFAPGVMDDIIESFKIHFINETPDAISFSYDARSPSGASLFRHKGMLHPFGHLYLHPLTLEEVNEQPRFHWEVSVAAAKHKVPVGGLLRIRPAQLVRHIQDMLEQNNPAFSVLLAQDAEQVAPPAAEPPAVGSECVVKTEPRIVLHTLPEAVLDLHISSEKSQERQRAPEEILQLQLGILQQKLQAALAAGMEGMIVIHGIGNGTLRQKVHELLSGTEGVASFSNHWMGGYGWGATEVVFKAT